MKAINRIEIIIKECMKKICDSTSVDYEMIKSAYASLWEKEIRNRFGECAEEDQICRYVKDRMREILMQVN